MGWFKSLFCGVKWLIGVDQDSYDTKAAAIAASPFVTTKPSHMYFDDDGDLAEEFYEEVISYEGRPWMKRITQHLTWQGIIPLDIPRLHVDFPVVIYHG